MVLLELRTTLFMVMTGVSDIILLRLYLAILIIG